MVILNLLGISYHAVVVFGQGKNLLFKSVAGHCVYVLKVPGGSSVSRSYFYWCIFPNGFLVRLARIKV